MNRFYSIVALAALGCSSPAAVAPEPEPVARSTPPPEGREAVRLRLDEALELADRAHPELSEARAHQQAALGRARQAGAWPNPELVARVEAAGTRDSEEFVAGVSQGFPIGGRLGAARRAEELEAERLLLEFEAKRRSVRSRVHAAFATALFAEQAVALQKEAAQDAEKAAGVARSLVAAGEALPIDATRARTEVVRAEVERERAESLSKEALIALTAAIGQSGLEIRAVEGSLETAIELPSLESLAAELANHPVLKAARAGVQAEEARLDLAEARKIPDVNLDLFYRRLDQTGEDGYDVGLSVMLPVFDRQRGAMREARADRRAAQSRVEMSAINLSRDLRQAHLRLSRALSASRAMKEGLVTQQEEVARAFEARHAAGDASLSETLPVRRDRTAARLAYLESLRDVMEAWAGVSTFMSKR